MSSSIPRQTYEAFIPPNGSLPKAGTANYYASPVDAVKNIRFHGWVWFIVAFILIGLVLYFLKPGFVTSQNVLTGDTHLDWGKLLLWTALGAGAFTLILWLTRGSHNLVA